MLKMNFRTFAVVMLLATSQVFAAGLNFKEWKAKRVAEKASLVKAIKNDKSLVSAEKATKLNRAEQNLTAEKELTPEDYFHLYISQNFKSNPIQARETVERLSQKELADIVMSYLKLKNQLRDVELNSIRLQTSR